MEGRILVVDDEPFIRAQLANLLQGEGCEVQKAANAFAALQKLAEFAPHVVLADLRLPGMDGLELLRRVHADDPDRAVILMTGDDRVASAVEATRAGAADYLVKPFDLGILLRRIGELLAARHDRPIARRVIPFLVGESPPMRALCDLLELVAPSRATILLSGETGTGKERIAEAIHALSPRSAGPLVKLHCAGLAESLLESELFGHERGAFTGAVSSRAGRLELAHGGTLFLDEVGELSPATQVKLLRFLQEHAFERVGCSRTTRIDVRVVAATNRDLAGDVAHGRFRQDLYYRLNVVGITVPALRERRDDIPLLVDHLLARCAAHEERASISPEAMACLLHHTWPGNVRELEHVLERALVMGRGPRIERGDLPEELASARAPSMPPAIPGATLAELERFAIRAALEHTGGRQRAAARLLGICPRTLRSRMRRYMLLDAAPDDEPHRPS